MTREGQVAVAVVVISLAVLGVLLAFPDYGEICAQGQYAKPEQCANYDVFSYYFLKTVSLFQKYNGAIVALATVVITAFTFTLVRIGSRQTELTEIVQRAQLSVEPQGVSPWSGSNSRFSAHVGIRNSGHLPARNVSWVLHIEIAAEPNRESFDIINEPRGNHTIPGGTVVRRGTIDWDLRAEELPRSKPYLYVWGIVNYDDGFGNPRFTKFCHRYNCAEPDFQTTRRVKAKNGRYHYHGNDAD